MRINYHLLLSIYSRIAIWMKIASIFMSTKVIVFDSTDKCLKRSISLTASIFGIFATAQNTCCLLTNGCHWPVSTQKCTCLVALAQGISYVYCCHGNISCFLAGRNVEFWKFHGFSTQTVGNYGNGVIGNYGNGVIG